MKKLCTIFIFIFLSSLFCGIFFSTNLSAENNAALSTMLIDALTSPSFGFFKGFIESFFSNALLLIMMLPAAFTIWLSFLPIIILCCKGFAIGFCSGMLYINAGDDAFFISLVKLLPQNLFFIPAFIFIATIIFRISTNKHSSAAKQKPALSKTAAVMALLVVAGSLTEALLHLIAL